MSEKACGCIARTWYGCIKSGKENCDGKSSYMDDNGKLIEYEHCCDYEEQPFIDRSSCKYLDKDA